jgi:hypothetical protein
MMLARFWASIRMPLEMSAQPAVPVASKGL